MNDRIGGARTGLENYLDVRYSAAERPYTSYPRQLTAHLTERYLGAHRGQALLDLGCGRGEFLQGFAELGFEARGVDRARPTLMVDRVLQADYERDGLPYPDASFGVLFSKSVFEHISDISRVLNECLRVLAPGGRMIAMVPDWRSQWRHFYDDWTHVRPFTLQGLDECVRSHGFVRHTAVRFRQLPFLWDRPYLRPIADAASLLPNSLKRYKTVRFAKEWMLLVIADKPLAENVFEP